MSDGREIFDVSARRTVEGRIVSVAYLTPSGAHMGASVQFSDKSVWHAINALRNLADKIEEDCRE